MDKGREFNNAKVRTLLKEFRVDAHLTTPGHPRSHGTVERLHSTITEHLRLLKLDRGLRIRVGDTTWVKNWYRRRKEDKKFVGPFRVVRKLTRFRVRVQDVATGRVRVVHVNETRVPRSGEADVLV
ncbi:hypothetical protein AAG570_008402 [Ranatra chinensis]|uniref:Integrase catalytic domain-containing protein n=1 Tax=Ranatra chinensis TaxID=642074 RepID=A0ABD0ZC05_9HEMI